MQRTVCNEVIIQRFLFDSFLFVSAFHLSFTSHLHYVFRSFSLLDAERRDACIDLTFNIILSFFYEFRCLLLVFMKDLMSFMTSRCISGDSSSLPRLRTSTTFLSLVFNFYVTFLIFDFSVPRISFLHHFSHLHNEFTRSCCCL